MLLDFPKIFEACDELLCPNAVFCVELCPKVMFWLCVVAAPKPDVLLLWPNAPVEPKLGVGPAAVVVAEKPKGDGAAAAVVTAAVLPAEKEKAGEAC